MKIATKYRKRLIAFSFLHVSDARIVMQTIGIFPKLGERILRAARRTRCYQFAVVP